MNEPTELDGSAAATLPPAGATAGGGARRVRVAPEPAGRLRPVHELLAEAAARAPEAPALRVGEDVVSRGELDARAGRLALRLRALGVGAETPVGCFAEASPELVAGVLATWKAGGAYLPLDPAHPRDRLEYVLADAGAPVLLTTRGLVDRLPPHAARVVLLDDGADGRGVAARPESAAAAPGDLAYVVYTSGSTGAPKGVRVEHRSLAATLLAAGSAFGFGPEDLMPALASHAFDIWLFETFAPLLAGGAVRLVARERVREAEALADELADVTALHAVPALMRELAGAAARRGGSAFPRLRRAFVGGDAVPPELVARMAEAFPRAALHVLYGPTEAAIVCAALAVPPGGVERQMAGRALGSAALHVLGEGGEPAADGEPGELYVGGAGVARGYLGRPDLTAERFIPDPFGGEARSGARLYRTGDRVRRLPDGALEFLGRVDRQVKVRGFRIEPGEVEAALERHPGVAQAVVDAREDRLGERRLVAWTVGRGEGDAPDAAALRAHLRATLPEFMVPAAFVALDALPLNANGKLDRRALPEPAPVLPGEGRGAPLTPTEELLAGMFADVLGVERVGTGDDFFASGGHSLRATRLATRVRDTLGIELPLSAVFDAPTVAALAERVDTLLRDGGAGAPPPIVPAPRDALRPLPLSFAQQRLWFQHRMDPADAGYHMPFPLRLRGRLDERALAGALGELARRHEALRTVFRPAPGSAVQVILPAAPVPLPAVDLRRLEEAGRGREVLRLAEEDAERPFDLERGPVLRAALALSGEGDAVLLLNLHHVVSDGWSMGVLFRELPALYDALARGEPSPLPELPVQYADFAVWQREWLSGERLQPLLGWWEERLRGASPLLELPTDRPRPAAASARGGLRPFRVPAPTAHALRGLARRQGATLYMATLAAFGALLRRHGAQEDAVVGTPIAGRNRRETEGLIGLFVNTLALRLDLSGDPTFAGLLGRVRETTLGAYAHQDLPFDLLVEAVAPERSLSHTPLFQVMFALQNTPGEEASPSLAGVRVEPLRETGMTAQFLGISSALFDLEMELLEDGEEVSGSLRFRADLFDPPTVERMAAHYLALLEGAAADPGRDLSLLPLLPPEERRALESFGTGGAAAGDPVPVHLAFAARAAAAPDAPAVSGEDGWITCAELDAAAARLAGRLRREGVVPGTTVGVCVERGPGVVAALLAVWKAGGVYLPLDPSLPAERLAFLLRDSGAGLALAGAHLVPRLAAGGVRVLVDRDGGAESGPPRAPHPVLPTSPGELAYLIYTSGSTGKPKGVMVAHGQLAHTLAGAVGTLGFGPGDVAAALAPVAFDISLLELLAPLLAGGAVRVVPREQVRDPQALVEAAADATVLHAVPALLRQLVAAAPARGGLPRLRTLLVGGDLVPPDLLQEARAIFPGARIHVLYGPTEATIICAVHEVPREGPVEGHPIGRPLPGVRLAVCDPRGEPVPIGVPGEVRVAGPGVAPGYLGRPELTADGFVPDPAGGRAYRTGDRALWRPDGTLEFLGRTDTQVKVRGFRIEPGEVEAALCAHPEVREAVVVAREEQSGERRLVAYVVPGAAEEAAGGGAEQVGEWAALFDDTYARGGPEEDPTLNLTGWNSSYTGEPIPRGEMREWVEHTVGRILALRPERVLEVGCGTGLLLFRVAPHVRHYHGTDFSAAALAHVRRHLGGLPQVELSRREADRLEGLEGEGFDVAVLNSVAQYFPGVDYLLRVLEGMAAVVRPGGRVLVGDVRSLPLLGAFHASVETHRAADGLSLARVRERVRLGVVEEQELAVDPALFEALRTRIPRLGRVEVQAKRGRSRNEVACFRYDVVLHLDREGADAAEPAVREWDGEDAAALRGLLAAPGEAVLVRGVPDARVREHVRAQELVGARAGGPATAGELRRALAGEGGVAVEPEDCYALAEALGRAVEVRPGAPGRLDVLFAPVGGAAAFPARPAEERPWEAYANDPRWGRRVRRLVPELRASLRDRLPEYMVPSAFVLLEALPVTPNGKVDRAALPAPDPEGGAREGEYAAPRTRAEEALAAIWAETLGTERVGIRDGFFDLGGHSLLAIQVISRVREALGVEVPLRALFEAPTVEGLAGRVERAIAESPRAAAGPPLVPAPRGGPLPLSFSQQRLWFAEKVRPGNAVFHLPVVLRLHGGTDAAALGRALAETVRRHEALRTVFVETEGAPAQVVLPPGTAALPVADLSALPPAAREVEARRRVVDAIQLPFDLGRGPLLRALLLRLEDDDIVLLLCVHHVVSDGWSMQVLTREVAALYAAFARGDASPLPELPVQYADFAVWQRALLAGPALEAQLAWWRERLAGAPTTLELPADRPRPAEPRGPGAILRRTLPREVAEAVPALARREGATPYMTLLAVFAVLLSRWSGEEEVLVGTPVANRARRELEGLIGFFVNTLPVRARLSGAPTFREVLARVRDAVLGAHAHQDVPFERLVEALRVERSPAYAPLVQVMFSTEDPTAVLPPLPGAEVEEVDLQIQAGELDMEMRVQERPGGLALVLHYRPDLFDASTAGRLLDAYALLLAEVAADAGLPVAELPLLTEAERRFLDELGDGGPPAAGAGVPFPAAFAALAARTPDAAAALCGAERLSYAELDAGANRLARHLLRLGAGRGRPVGICLERGPRLLVALLAAWRAGGVYLPLDPAYPAERLAFLLRDAGAELVVTDAAGRALALDAALVSLDADAGRIAAEDPSDPGAAADADAPAYVIYTSGSTGVPKGVAVSHGQLAHTLAAAAGTLGLGPGDRVPSVASPAFDISLLEMLAPLLAGGSVLFPGVDAADVERLVEAARGATVLHAVPALMREVVRAARASGGLPGVHTLLVGGDLVPPDLLEEMRAAFPAARVRVMYGPTEAAIVCAAASIPPEPIRGGLLGRPLPGVRLRVCDPRGEPVPVGVAGEVCVAGGGVALGYLSRPELTAERFVVRGGERAYRTGDRARWRADGTLEFLGRTDAQLKVRGFRVEPGEIEAALLAHPGARQAVVVAREDAAGDRRLVAYVVAEPGAEPAPAELRAALRGRLPGHMVPSAFVLLEALPLTPNGKVDARALPPPGELPAREHVAPRSRVEEVLARDWAEVIGVGRVGVHDNFFDLGGHSLLATQLVARMKALRVEVPVRQLFQTPTVAGLAEAIVRSEAQPGATEMIAGILLKLRTMSPEERAAALRARHAGAPS